MSSRIPLNVLVVHADDAVRADLVDRLDGDLVAARGVDTVSGADRALADVDDGPDVVVSGVDLPDGEGLELVARVRTRSPRTASVVLVEPDDAAGVADAIRAGADAIATSERLDAAIIVSASDTADGTCLVHRDPANALASVCPPGVRSILSPRELEVLDCLAHGLTNAQAARRLYVSRETVKTHVARVLRKLEVSDRRAAAERAHLLGLVPQVTASPAGAPVLVPDDHASEDRHGHATATIVRSA